MDSAKQISHTVDQWIVEEQIQRIRIPRVIRKNDPWSGMSEEEIEDIKEYIRCYLNRDFEILLQMPIASQESDFWFSSYQEFLESPFNTHDYQRDRRPFDRYGYRIRKVLERVKDLAILYSCLGSEEGREDTLRRFQNLLDREFRMQLLSLVERYKNAVDEEKKLVTKGKIRELNRRILTCRAIWEQYAHWE